LENLSTWGCFVAPSNVTRATVGLAFAVVLCAQTARAQRPAQRPEIMLWNIAGESRAAWVYAPSVKTPSGKAPLVLSFHGHGDSVQNFQRNGLHRSFPEAIVVYVEGSSVRLDGFSGWQTEKGEDHDRDLQLVDAVLASLHEKFSVDDARIYATGFSNGAGFTYLLWAERPKVFAAFAPVAGRLRPSVLPLEPRPLLHVGGRQDGNVPFRDQRNAIETARRVNGATDKGESCGTGCTLYGSSARAPVIAWIHSGGHEYPAGTSDGIAKFFRDHPGEPHATADLK
jgi:polyhydroxybutyrate depolymerase